MYLCRLSTVGFFLFLNIGMISDILIPFSIPIENKYLSLLRKEVFLRMGRDKKGLYILRASKTKKDGTKIYARDYGLKAFKIYLSK